MATTQKTVLRRFNGTDWDAIYLANSADITFLAKSFAVAASDTGFTEGEVLSADETVADLLSRAINRLAYLDNVTIPALKDGSAITSIKAEQIDGRLTRDQLPEDIAGSQYFITDEESLQQLVPGDVKPGDYVVDEKGKIYYILGFETDDEGNTEIKYLILNTDASEVYWHEILEKPTTLEGYGITDAVNKNQVVDEAKPENRGKILTLDGNGKLPASITGDAFTVGGLKAEDIARQAALLALEESYNGTVSTLKDLAKQLMNSDASWIKTGTIDIDRLPHGALERIYMVDSPEKLADLTTVQVQNGDTVKVVSTQRMYYVVFEEKLGTTDYMNAFTEYTAGVASAVDWSGVQNKPTTIKGYGITDAISTESVVASGGSAADAGKLIKLNAQGKLDVDITGSVDWNKIANKPNVTAKQIEDAVKATEIFAKFGEVTDEDGNVRPTYDGKELAYKDELSDVNGGLMVVDDLPEDAVVGQLVLAAVRDDIVESIVTAPIANPPADYKVSIAWSGTDVYNVKITATGVKKSINGLGQEGHWFGAAMYAPDGETQLQRVMATTLEELATKELSDYGALDTVNGKKAYAIYFNNKVSKTRCVKLKWGNRTPVIYHFNIDEVTNADD